VHVFQPCKKKNQSKLNIKGMLPLYYNASRKDYGVHFPLVFPRVFFYFCCRSHTSLAQWLLCFFWLPRVFLLLPLSYNAWRCGHELRQQSQSTVYRDFDIMCQCTCGVPLPVVFLRCSLGVLCFYYRHRLSLADLLSFGFITGTLTLCASVTRALTFQELKHKCVSGKYATGLGTKGGFMNYDNTVKSLGA
jgi:hypothetical protein